MNKRLTDELEDLRFTSNKISDCLDSFRFDSLERRRLREAQDILDNKRYEWEEFRDEEECWS